MDKESASINVQLVPVEQGDSVDLMGIYHFLNENRSLILIISMLCLAISTSYYYFRDREYEVKYYLSSPSISEIARLSAVLSDDAIDFESIYVSKLLSDLFVNSSKSRGLRMDFYTENKNAILGGNTDLNENSFLTEFDNYFNKKISYEINAKPEKIHGDNITITFLSQDPNLSSELLNDFVEFINHKTFTILKEKSLISLSNEKTELESEAAKFEELFSNYEEKMWERVENHNNAENENLNKLLLSTLAVQFSSGTRIFDRKIEIHHLENQIQSLKSTEDITVVSLMQPATPSVESLPFITPAVIVLSFFNGLFLGVFISFLLRMKSVVQENKIKSG